MTVRDGHITRASGRNELTGIQLRSYMTLCDIGHKHDRVSSYSVLVSHECIVPRYRERTLTTLQALTWYITIMIRLCKWTDSMSTRGKARLIGSSTLTSS